MRARGVGLAVTSVIAVLVILGHVAEARITSTSGYFSALRNVRVKYGNIGQVCEEVARIDLEAEFDQGLYMIDTNLEYGSRFQVAGELDVVIFDRLTGRAARVYEIKCWSNDSRENRALKRAQEQRKRFFDQINFGAAPDIWSKKRAYSAFQFRHLRPDQYRTGGPRGATGFDYSLPLNLEQLEQLFKEIVDCQRAGDCAQP